MSDKLENKNIETVQSSLEQITTHDELLQKLWNLKLNQIIKKERWDMYEVTTEIDDIYWKKWDTFLVKKELFDQATKEKEQQLETQATVESVNADSEKLWETVQTTIETKQQTQLLQIESQQQQRLERAPFTTIEWYITALEELENDFKLKKKLVGRNFWEKIGDPFKKDDTKERMQKETNEKINAWIKYLWDLKKEKKDEEKATNKHNTKSLKKGLTEYTPKITQTDLDNFMDAFQQEGLLEDDIKKFQAGKLEPSAGFPLTSKKYVKRNIKESRKYYEMKKDINKLKNNAAVLTIFGNNEAEAERYFDAVINGQMSPNMNQYNQQLANYFGQNIADYPFAANAVLRTNGYIPFGWSSNSNYRNISPQMRKTPSSYKNLDWGETFKVWGINGTIRKVFDQFPNLSEKQKDTRSQLGSLAIVGVGLYKGIQWLFKSPEKGGMKWWQKGLTLAGITLGTQVLLWEDPISLVNKLMTGWLSFDDFKKKFENSTTFFGWKEAKEYQDNYSLLQCFGEMTPAELQNNMKIWEKSPADWKSFYTPMLTTYGGYPAFKALWPNYNNKKMVSWLNNIGIGFPTSQEMESIKIKDIKDKMSKNQEFLNTYITKTGQKVDSKKQEEINTYLSHKDLSDTKVLEDMQKEGLFIANTNAAYTEREQDLKYLSTMEHNIKTQLTSLSEKEKEELYLWAKLFYNERTIENKPKFEFSQEGEKIFMTSHVTEDGRKQKIEINIKDRSISRLAKDWVPLEFPNMREMIRVAYLSNGLLNITKDFSTHNPNPFEFRSILSSLQLKSNIPTSWSGIYFDGKTWDEWGLDTQLVSYWSFFGRFGKMDNVSEVIHKHPEVYSNYLNILWKEKVWLSSSSSQETESTTSFENIVDNANTKAQVEKLSITDSEKVEIQTTLNTLRQDTTAIDQQRGALSISSTSFSSLGETTPISLEKKTIDGLNNNQIEISFKNYAELIEAAHIINRIKQETKNKIPYNKTDKWKVPFCVDGSKQIQFRQLDGSPINIFWHFASRIEDLFNKSTLNTNKEYLANYLNTWFINKTTS